MNPFLAKVTGAIAWRIPGHGARKLFKFALAEHGSMLDLSAAAHLTPSPARKAAYLRHLTDEARHATMFSLRSKELRANEGKESFGHPQADFEHLFEMLGEVRFLAFVHLGESRGRRQFEVYRDWFARRGDVKTRALFEAIIKDELQHEHYTWELLVQLTNGEKQARREVRKAAAWEAWRLWRRSGRFVAEKLYFISSVLLYLCLAPFSLLVRLARKPAHGWTQPSEKALAPIAAPQPLPAPGQLQG